MKTGIGVQSKIRCCELSLMLCISACSFFGCRAQAQVEEPSTGTSTAPSGTAIAEPATVTSGTVHPEFPDKGGYPPPQNKLDPGTESAEEKGHIASVMPGVKPRLVITAYTAKLANKQGPPVLQSGQLLYTRSDALREVFPDRLFYVVRFRVWPIAFDIPEPMKSNNVFAVDPKGQFKLLTDIDSLTAFFKSNATPAKDDASVKTAVKAWLDLSQELNQDGFFKYSLNDSSITSREEEGLRIGEGRVNIEPRGGDEGYFSVRLKFDSAGRLTSAEEKRDIKEGMRPICQSTKLLDPDPIVRKMARRDLLIMGRRAKPYLDEQRAKASPEIRKAIDEIWSEIMRENRQ